MAKINGMEIAKQITSNILFIKWLRDHEMWLMERILDYAKKYDYTRYTSTLVEPWRISIVGLTDSLELLMKEYSTPPALGPDDDYNADPASAFGLLEAQRHRSRGVNFAMFISLFKYYRQTFHDLIEIHQNLFEDSRFYYEYVKQFFDRVEIAYSIEWHGRSAEDQIHELSIQNRHLTNEKNLYLTVFDSFSSGCILLDSYGLIINYNQSASAILFGKKHYGGSHYYKEDKTISTPEWISEAIENFGDNDLHRFFYEQLRNNERFIYDVFIRPMDDISGKFSGYIVILNDVSALKISQEQFELAINATKDGLWDWNLVNNSIYFSPHWKEMLGYRDDELTNVLQTWIDLVHPDDLESENNAIEKCLQTPGIEYEHIYRLRHKNGHYIWNLDRGEVLFNDEAKAVRMLGFHTDITHLKEIEEKIHYLAAILEEATTEIYIFDAETHAFLYANKSAVANIGYSLEEIYQCCVLDINPMKEEELTHYLTLVDAQASVSFGTENRRKDGSYYPITVILQPTYYEDHRAYVAMITDVSTQEEMLGQINDTQELMIAQSRQVAMGEMIGMIAHQWRQPITVIAMGANNILADIVLEDVSIERFAQEAKDVLKQTEYLSKTIDDFRNFFRPNKEKDEVKVQDVLLEAKQIIGKSLEHHNIELSIVSDENEMIYTYSRELLQVFLNLLKNSKEALETNETENAYINVSIESLGDSIIIRVCDNGGGIDASIIGRIFEPYFSTKDKKTGTGLGLYMSKTIIEKHLNGTITAINTDDGVCFMITISKESTTKGENV